MPQAQGLPAWRASPTIAPPVSAGIINGGFETGNFTGWTVVNQVDGSGDWFVYSGTVSPLSFFTIAAPPEGNFAATSDQTGPGSHILFQDVALAPSQEHALSFILYYENQNGDFFTPASLDYTVFPNQQYRVDVMDPAAPVDSVAPGDVLANLFQTRVGDPASLAPTLMTFSLSAFAGRTVRLRFAEVDNQFFFQGFGGRRGHHERERVAAHQHRPDDEPRWLCRRGPGSSDHRDPQAYSTPAAADGVARPAGPRVERPPR